MVIQSYKSWETIDNIQTGRKRNSDNLEGIEVNEIG